MRNSIEQEAKKLDLVETKYKGYWVNRKGEVWSSVLYKHFGFKKLKPANSFGYHRVCLHFGNGLHKNMVVHRLIAEVFIPNPENKCCVNHINGIKTDNRVENLEWVTPSENTLHAYRIGLLCPLYGVDNPSSFLTEQQVLDIYQRLLDGELVSDISKIYNISYAAIRRIKHKDAYTKLLNHHYPNTEMNKIFSPKLSERDFCNIVEDYKNGLDIANIARKYGKAYITIDNLLHKRKYKDYWDKYYPELTLTFNKISRLNDELFLQIVDLYKQGYSFMEISKVVNITKNSVSNALNKKSKIAQQLWEKYYPNGLEDMKDAG